MHEDIHRVAGRGLLQANGIDSAGNITGSYEKNFEEHAFRWNASAGLVDLGTLGQNRSVGYGISGAVTVGVVGLAPNEQAFISDASGMRLLPMTHAYGVNASGVVVGDLFTANVPHAVKYESDVVTQLGTMVSALAITDAGLIAGYESGDTAVTWSGGTITRLGPGRATAINQAGDTVVVGNTIYRAGVVISVTVPHEIAPCAVSSATAFSANDTPWVVGSAFCQNAPEGSAQLRPTLYHHGVGRDINSLLTNPPMEGEATAVNNAGQIAANFRHNTQSAAMAITCVTPGS